MFCCVVLLISCATTALAQDYPNRLIQVYLGFPPGTSLDLVTRHFTERLAKISGQTVVVENKVGASGMIAMEAAVRSKPDGYTLVFGPGLAASAFQFKALPFDPVKDFARVASIVAFPFVLVVNPRTMPVSSVAELTAALKTKNKVSYGSPNTLSQVAGALYADAAGFAATSVQYKSMADAVRDVAAGDLEFMFSDAGFAFSQIRDGKLKGLAVTLPRRTPNAPDLPTMVEAGATNVNFYGWMGVYTPAGTPADAVRKLSQWLLEIADAEDTKKFFQRIGADPFAQTAEQFSAWEAEEFKRWEERAQIAKIERQ